MPANAGCQTNDADKAAMPEASGMNAEPQATPKSATEARYDAMSRELVLAKHRMDSNTPSQVPAKLEGSIWLERTARSNAARQLRLPDIRAAQAQYQQAEELLKAEGLHSHQETETPVEHLALMLEKIERDLAALPPVKVIAEEIQSVDVETLVARAPVLFEIRFQGPGSSEWGYEIRALQYARSGERWRFDFEGESLVPADHDCLTSRVALVERQHYSPATRDWTPQTDFAWIVTASRALYAEIISHIASFMLEANVSPEIKADSYSRRSDFCAWLELPIRMQSDIPLSKLEDMQYLPSNIPPTSVVQLATCNLHMQCQPDEARTSELRRSLQFTETGPP